MRRPERSGRLGLSMGADWDSLGFLQTGAFIRLQPAGCRSAPGPSGGAWGPEPPCSIKAPKAATASSKHPGPRAAARGPGCVESDTLPPGRPRQPARRNAASFTVRTLAKKNLRPAAHAAGRVVRRSAPGPPPAGRWRSASAGREAVPHAAAACSTCPGEACCAWLRSPPHVS